LPSYCKNFTHLYVIGFAIQANARILVETCEAAVGIAATYVQATPDLMMGELLKTTRASQIFSVCGMPEIAVKKLNPEKAGGPPRYQVELLGYDVFDPATMELDHRQGDDVPACMLDADYNGLVFHGAQVFFPRTSAWDSLKKALKATHEESVIEFHSEGYVPRVGLLRSPAKRREFRLELARCRRSVPVWTDSPGRGHRPW
jgi:adenine-specific DNA-methyltransferase